MSLKFLSYFICFCSLLFGCYFYSKKNFQLDADSVIESELTTPQFESKIYEDGYIIDKNGGLIENSKSKNKYYAIKAEYPQINNAFGEQIIINKLLYDIIFNVINLFKKYQTPRIVTNEDISFGLHIDTLQIKWELIYLSKDFLSIRFISDTYHHGAAHGSQSAFNFNYDLKNKTLLKFPDIFKQDEKSIDSLIKLIAHEFVIQDYIGSLDILKKNQKEEIIFNYDPNRKLELLHCEGAPYDMDYYMHYVGKSLKDKLDRYKKKSVDSNDFRYVANPWSIDEFFNITATGIVFIFNPYEIGCYAMGFREVMIDYNSLEKILHQNCALSPLVSQSSKIQLPCIWNPEEHIPRKFTCGY